MKSYRVNEIFYSLQGEGVRAGTPNVFVRFAACNLKCNREEHGFDCDTEFVSGVSMRAEDILDTAYQKAGGQVCSIIWTGGEPSLQLDVELVNMARARGWYQCIETNGTNELPDGLDWISCSPKTAEHTLRIRGANEVRYVRHHGMGLPKPSIESLNYCISPAFQPDGKMKQEDLEWCVGLVKDEPTWRLSVQQHKQWGMR